MCSQQREGEEKRKEREEKKRKAKEINLLKRTRGLIFNPTVHYCVLDIHNILLHLEVVELLFYFSRT
jgi:hypothetical protein